MFKVVSLEPLREPNAGTLVCVATEAKKATFSPSNLSLWRPGRLSDVICVVILLWIYNPIMRVEVTRYNLWP
jgi:hypothetical protein